VSESPHHIDLSRFGPDAAALEMTYLLIAVRVEGITHEGLVLVRHQAGEPGEHRADQTVGEFLASHVRADDVPFIGDAA
jgi:hypothetical protein